MSSEMVSSKIKMTAAEILRVQAVINEDITKNPKIVLALQIPTQVCEIPVVVTSKDNVTPTIRNKSEDNNPSNESPPIKENPLSNQI